ncbi:MAG: hypothetical protein LBD54_02800 [Puniceicoccales bacterium]|nr:hypothetical protein [Puniceicoccales bacterium]
MQVPRPIRRKCQSLLISAGDPRWASAQRLRRGAQQQNLKVLGSPAEESVPGSVMG